MKYLRSIFDLWLRAQIANIVRTLTKSLWERQS